MSTRDAILGLRKDKSAMEFFETADGEENQQETICQAAKSLSDRKKSEDVVQLDLKPTLAFAKFAGKIYDPAKPDTSSSQLQARVSQIPFAASASSSLGCSSSSHPSSSAANLSWSAPHTIFESPIDKFNRIKHEIQSFRSDLSALISSNPLPQSEDGGVSELASILSAELNELDHQLNAVMSEKKLRALLVSEGDILDEFAHTEAGEKPIPNLQQLIQQLQKGTQITSAPSSSESKLCSSSSSSSATSSFSSSSSSLHAGVVSQLDRRLAALERTIRLPLGLGLAASGSASSSSSSAKSGSALGSDSKDKDSKKLLSVGASSSSFAGNVYANQVSVYPDLQSGLFSLHRKLSLLDAGKLESMNRAIKSLISDLEVLEQNKQTVSEHSTTASGSPDISSSASSSSSPPSSAHQQKIHELYEVLSRWDAWALQVPLLVSRLQSLRAVHEASAGAIQRLGQLEAAQTELENVLGSDRKALEKLAQSWPANLATIEKNMSSLEERIGALTKKLEGK